MGDSVTPGSSSSNEEEVVIVLAAIDMSSLASAVVDFAGRTTRRMWPEAQLHLLHVLRSARFDRRAHAGVAQEQLLADAHDYLDHCVRMARRQSPSPVTGHFASGDPVDEILRRARSLSADLLIIGTQDAMGLEKLLLGSVADKVTKRAPCSVVVVRKKQRPYTKIS